ncbi:GMC oxidoreductase [Zopfia rhizophila CBS 207.26]|uniref:GMC oxidoreductase n=1 Tax=Zopfia rhizophila CBS 207.26 TaxID=1314779 RepID=A0A6A6DZZ5_9PEZI|nr:GMC oxidoreductase [Zopfia rhizophila CBS 207.26]
MSSVQLESGSEAAYLKLRPVIETNVKAEDQVEEEYDYVVAGGGTAGLTIGDRLSADGKYSVLIIEYGSLGMDSSRQFEIPSVPQPGLNNRQIRVIVGKLVGGSSAINGLQFFRGTKEEYDLWVEVDGRGSAWDWKGMLPYFKRGIHFIPPLDYPAKDFNITWAFFHPTTMDPKYYTRSYARTRHWDGINRPNYSLLIHSKVTKILFDEDHATGLNFIAVDSNSSQFSTVKARKEVILATGTIHTPQILQLSGIGPADLLKQANITPKVGLPGVGANFQDHGYTRGSQFTWTVQPPPPNITQLGDPATGLTSDLGAIIGLPVITPNKTEILAKKFEDQDPAAYLPNNTHPTVMVGYRVQKNIINKSPSFVSAQQHPMSRGTVYIDRKNPTAEPIVDYRAFNNPIDIEVTIEMTKFIRRYMDLSAFAPYQPKETRSGVSFSTDTQLEDWIRRQCIPSVYYPVGTAAKMPRELRGVVDEELLVYGVKGLSVVDASMMLIIPGCPTVMTEYAIAEKAVDYIKEGTQS